MLIRVDVQIFDALHLVTV